LHSPEKYPYPPQRRFEEIRRGKVKGSFKSHTLKRKEVSKAKILKGKYEIVERRVQYKNPSVVVWIFSGKTQSNICIICRLLADSSILY